MSGTPNLDIQPSKKAPATVLEGILGIGITSDHLVYRSIIVPKKLAFIKRKCQAGSFKLQKNCIYGLLMVLPCPRSNQYIIKIHEDILNSPQNRIDKLLECLGSIFKPKRHSQVLIQPKWRNDSYFTV
uniref:Uncharacterized protein n=1 Tax=Lepeophtheirus salmonis TaxID=72036 RepID=A0A0K2UXL2_LEPSM